VPASGHTEDWWTIEHYYSDLDLSEVFYDCKPSKMSVKVAATGIPTIDFDILGLNVNMLTTSTSPYFSAPTAITTTEQCLAAKAIIILSGTVQTVATSFNVDITGNNKTLPAVISSVTKPGISDGVLEVSGSLSVYFENETIRDMFRNETDAAIYAVLPLSNEADADFVAFTLPACVLTTATKDGDQEIVQTVSFQAKFNAAGDDGSTCTVNSLATTISIQDSKVS
ncbi:MAG TPA: phage tail tube protein, partial [Syntrophales bacterium]|nr:phage tail tube protein [Syntrophales bacterium]